MSQGDCCWLAPATKEAGSTKTVGAAKGLVRLLLVRLCCPLQQLIAQNCMLQQAPVKVLAADVMTPGNHWLLCAGSAMALTFQLLFKLASQTSLVSSTALHSSFIGNASAQMSPSSAADCTQLLCKCK